MIKVFIICFEYSGSKFLRSSYCDLFNILMLLKKKNITNITILTDITNTSILLESKSILCDIYPKKKFDINRIFVSLNTLYKTIILPKEIDLFDDYESERILLSELTNPDKDDILFYYTGHIIINNEIKNIVLPNNKLFSCHLLKNHIKSIIYNRFISIIDSCYSECLFIKDIECENLQISSSSEDIMTITTKYKGFMTNKLVKLIIKNSCILDLNVLKKLGSKYGNVRYICKNDDLSL